MAPSTSSILAEVGATVSGLTAQGSLLEGNVADALTHAATAAKGGVKLKEDLVAKLMSAAQVGPRQDGVDSNRAMRRWWRGRSCSARNENK